ncbi:SDR family NAD(P)-dependent oxidoreductase [Hanamia caeni]|jgi:UDP-glucuronate 4-epimerase|uniref:SDR family NAD(P)-dependent oxidoreductase n=1 Tax=Hanamia caeni TaxID=2294116 RepID=A0A3M9NJX0_9BACT|nr:SDR family NAD(P)-dependent oxidoreductase [Hanamia caeni]RNI37483.1 SDR family NAD(P)-dependent oxidoreductase [Hanamia caeni]
MNILVTGAAGFIGSHTCEFFLKLGNSVIGVDNFDDFYPVEFKELNLIGLRKNSRFRFYKTDIRDSNAIEDIFSENNVELVIHLAAKAGVRPSIESIEEYYDVNVNGTVSVLESMRKNGIRKMLFASSSSIYGNNPKVPFSEKDPVDNPISPYASTKKSGELLCHVYHHLYNFDISCLRFFTVYGPRQRPDLAIHKFTRLIDENKSIPFFGDGTTSRDYTYIDDIVEGINCALIHMNGYQVFNLGEAKVISLVKLVDTIEKSLHKKAVLNVQPMQAGDVTKTYADISKATSEIGYNPKFDFETGIKEFVKWYHGNKSVLYQPIEANPEV